MDLADVAGNASDGVHSDSAAGVWQALDFGFGGVRDFDGELSIRSHLPSAWRSLGFSLSFHGRAVRVELRHDLERYLLEEGEPLEVTIDGERRRLEPGSALELRPEIAGA